MKKCFILGLTVLFFSGQFLSAQVLTLEQALALAKENSNTLKAAQNESEAARLHAQSVNRKRLPKLSVDGTYHQQSVVPETTLGNSVVKFSDYYSYSIGPTISYTFWDCGYKKQIADSAKFSALSKEQQSRLAALQLQFNTQSAYVQVCLSSELLQFAQQAVALSQTQDKDIQYKFKFGAVNKLDLLSSQTEVANYQLKVAQAQADVVSALSDLRYFVGNLISGQTALETLEQLAAARQNKIQTAPTTHPLVQAQFDMAQALQSQVKAERALNWPIVNLQLRSSLDYPNGSKFEKINQNSMGVSLGWSWFEFGAEQKEIASKTAEQKAAAARAQDSQLSLARDFEKAAVRLERLNEQILQAQAIVSQQEELTQLNYASYKIGKISFSDVQNANLRLLDAKTKLAQLRAQALIQIFTIQFLLGKSR